MKKNESRLLTHSEIVQGVIKAVKLEKSSFTIGITSPWDKKN